MRMPVCKNNSTIAYIRTSLRHASRSARYSSLERMRGGFTSYLGCAMSMAGSTVTTPEAFRNRKKVLMELIFRETDFGVYLSAASFLRNAASSSCEMSAMVFFPMLARNAVTCSMSLPYATMVARARLRLSRCWRNWVCADLRSSAIIVIASYNIIPYAYDQEGKPVSHHRFYRMRDRACRHCAVICHDRAKTRDYSGAPCNSQTRTGAPYRA